MQRITIAAISSTYGKFVSPVFYVRVLLYFFCMFLISSAKAQSFDINDLKKNLYRHVSALAHDSMQGRLTGSPEMYVAADYIRKEFIVARLYAIKGYEQYNDSFDFENVGSIVKGLNVLACIPGTTKKNEFVIFSAHYDHIGIRGSNAGFYERKGSIDSVFNGANDNASGIAALIEIAKAYNNDSIRPARTIVFIAFSGDEQGLVGSTYFRNSLTNPAQIKVNINLAMLGILDSEGVIVTGDRHSDLRKTLNSNLKSLELQKKRPYFLKGRSWENFYLRSDNYPFAEIGIVSHCLMGGSGKRYYHTTGDEIGTLNFDKMAEVVDLIIKACRPILQDQEFKRR